jgi:hypothetical protein
MAIKEAMEEVPVNVVRMVKAVKVARDVRVKAVEAKEETAVQQAAAEAQVRKQPRLLQPLLHPFTPAQHQLTFQDTLAPRAKSLALVSKLYLLFLLQLSSSNFKACLNSHTSFTYTL